MRERRENCSLGEGKASQEMTPSVKIIALRKPPRLLLALFPPPSLFFSHSRPHTSSAQFGLKSWMGNP